MGGFLIGTVSNILNNKN